MYPVASVPSSAFSSRGLKSCALALLASLVLWSQFTSLPVMAVVTGPGAIDRESISFLGEHSKELGPWFAEGVTNSGPKSVLFASKLKEAAAHGRCPAYSV
jgi:hypothetical protein